MYAVAIRLRTKSRIEEIPNQIELNTELASNV